MWERLLELFKETYPNEENYVPASIAKREARRQELAARPIEQPIDQPIESAKEFEKGTLIGFDYLKGLKDDEDDMPPRRFGNLTKLLRGEYKDGEIEKTSGRTEKNIR